MTRPVPTAEAAFVRQGRALFRVRFPGEAHSFDAPSWDVRHLRTSQHRKTNARAYFTVYGSELNPLPPRFAPFRLLPLERRNDPVQTEQNPERVDPLPLR